MAEPAGGGDADISDGVFEEGDDAGVVGFVGGGGAEGGDGPEAYGGIGGFEGLDGGERIASNGVGNLPDAFEVDFSFAGEIGDGMAFFFDEVGHDAFGEAAGVVGLAAAVFKGGFC